MCGSNLKTVILPRNLKIINDTSFHNLPNLEQIIIPYGLKEIYGSSFKNCPKLTKLTIPDSVLRIEGLEYSNALYNNENYNKNGLFKINNHIIEYINNDVEHLEIPEGIVSVNCIRSTSLKSITFPPSVKYIAKISCENLESVTFSEGLIAAHGYDLFENCLSLKTIEFPASFRGFIG